MIKKNTSAPCSEKNEWQIINFWKVEEDGSLLLDKTEQKNSS